MFEELRQEGKCGKAKPGKYGFGGGKTRVKKKSYGFWDDSPKPRPRGKKKTYGFWDG